MLISWGLISFSSFCVCVCVLSPKESYCLYYFCCSFFPLPVYHEHLSWTFTLIKFILLQHNHNSYIIFTVWECHYLLGQSQSPGIQDVSKFSLLKTCCKQSQSSQRQLCPHLLDDLLRSLCSLVLPGYLVSVFCQCQPIHPQTGDKACLKALIVFTPVQVLGGIQWNRRSEGCQPSLSWLCQYHFKARGFDLLKYYHCRMLSEEYTGPFLLQLPVLFCNFL